MTEPELLKKFEELAGEMKRLGSWGSITVAFKEGAAHTIEKRVTYSVNGQGKGLPRHHNADKP